MPGFGIGFGFGPNGQTGSTSAVLPLDLPALSGVTWKAVWGVKALTKTWLNGNLFNIKIGTTTTTIKAVNGNTDIATLAAALGVSPTSGIGGAMAPQWFDQSGNTNDLPQAVTAHVPWVFLINGEVSLITDGWFADNLNSPPTADIASRYYPLPAGFTIDNRAHTVAAVVRLASSTNQFYTGGLTNTASVLFAPGDGVSFNNGFLWFPAQTILELIDGSFTSLGTVINAPTQPCVLSYASAASGLSFRTNDTLASGTAIPAGNSVGGSVLRGIPGGPNGVVGRTYAFLVAGSALTSTQQGALHSALYSLFNIKRNGKINILVDGASVDYGIGAYVNNVQDGTVPAATAGWEQFMIDDLLRSGYDARMYTSSSYGISIAQLTATWETNQKNFYDPTATQNILFASGLAVHNSLSGGRTPAQAFSDISAYVAAATANGRNWTKIIVLGDPNDNAGGAGNGAAYTALVSAGAAALGVTFLANPTANVPDSSSTYVNASGPSAGHSTIEGYRLESTTIIPFIKSLL